MCLKWKYLLRKNGFILHFILTTSIFFWISNARPCNSEQTTCADICKIAKERKERNEIIERKKKNRQRPSFTVNRKYRFTPIPEDWLASMRSWLNLGALDLRQQAAVHWLRDDRGLYVKRHAVIREMVICLSLLPDGIRAQICALMSLWSKTEITATAPICFHAWRLYPLTFSGTFASRSDLWLQ